MRRVLYLWLPHWPIDRMRRAAMLLSRKNSGAPAEETPFATVIDAAGRRLLAAVNPAASAAGLAPGMPLADAFSFLPGLATAAAEPAADAASLRRLAEWCGRYSPWTAPDGMDGVRVEITGCAHLWGGEKALAADLTARLDRQGVACHIAIADTLGAAWALARFALAGGSAAILPPGDARPGLAPLPVEALRLDPATAQGLRRVGLKRIGDLDAMPRAALARRFGDGVVRRLDQAQGDLPEPLSPLGEAPVRRVRLSFAEPIADPEDLARAAERLTQDLVRSPGAGRDGRAAARSCLSSDRRPGRAYRDRNRLAQPRPAPPRRPLQGAARHRRSRPRRRGRDPRRLCHRAVAARADQFCRLPFRRHPNPPPQRASEGRGVAPLLDRLGNRLGLGALYRLEPRESHIPERAAARVPVGGSLTRLAALGPLSRSAGEGGAADRRDGWVRVRGSEKPPRPIRLFEPPEPVEAFWLLPDDPPFRFTWRRCPHRVTRADGPERIAEEWWRSGSSGAVDAIRDYYRVEDEDGRRFWLFRAGLSGGDPPPRWFIHGLFA